MRSREVRVNFTSGRRPVGSSSSVRKVPTVSKVKERHQLRKTSATNGPQGAVSKKT